MAPLDSSFRLDTFKSSPAPVGLERQCTLRTQAQCAGVGVHSGQKVTLKLFPAAPNSGITFIRTDLSGDARIIPAQWDHVADTKLCTVLGNDHGASVGTVEHLMAALRAMDIDNATIELDGPEVPIMDGSAAPFVFLIEMAGTVEQAAPREWLEILRPVTVEHDGKRASLSPATMPSFAVEIDFASAAIARQRYSLTVTDHGFKTQISRARTFGFLEEVDHLRKLGLARGGSLHNAIVIQGDEILNKDGLRYPDEFARHKLLDAIGDLALAGAPILGHFEGIRTGHALNNKLLRAVYADPTAWRLATRPHPALGNDMRLRAAG